MMIENLKLAIFDMDGLMFDTERRYCDAGKAMMEKHGIASDMDAVYDVVGTSLGIDMKRFNLSGRPNEEVLKLLRQAGREAFEDMCENGVPVKKGLQDLLEELSRRGIQKAVATSTEIARSGRLLKAAGVWEQFGIVVTGEDVERGKPAPDIFLEACRRGGVSPKEALVLEDSINGARAAAAAGIRCIVVPDIKEPTPDVAESAYRVVESLRDVVTLLREGEKEENKILI